MELLSNEECHRILADIGVEWLEEVAEDVLFGAMNPNGDFCVLKDTSRYTTILYGKGSGKSGRALYNYVKSFEKPIVYVSKNNCLRNHSINAGGDTWLVKD